MNMHVHTLKPFGIPAGTDPRTWRQAVEARINDLLDQSMALITALDTMEADADLEDNGDEEHTLGWLERGPQRVGTDNTDRELDEADDEDGGDSEPEETDCDLAGATSDLEHDEGEGDCDLIIFGGMEDAI